MMISSWEVGVGVGVVVVGGKGFVVVVVVGFGGWGLGGWGAHPIGGTHLYPGEFILFIKAW